MCQEETQFLDLINSTDWKIESENDESRKILYSVFLRIVEGDKVSLQLENSGVHIIRLIQENKKVLIKRIINFK